MQHDDDQEENEDDEEEAVGPGELRVIDESADPIDDGQRAYQSNRDVEMVAALADGIEARDQQGRYEQPDGSAAARFEEGLADDDDDLAVDLDLYL